MARILVINPNSSLACGRGIEAAIAGFHRSDGLTIEVISLAEGPPAIYSWRDWHAAVAPICQRIESDPADAYVIACASDPGLEAARSVTARPVLGVFRAAVAAAMARAERFGVIAMAEASRARHLGALRAMGLEGRLAAEPALNLSIERLLDPSAARAALIDAARVCRDEGAEAVILGCTGMAHHRAAIEEAAGVTVIEPCQAGVGLALIALAT